MAPKTELDKGLKKDLEELRKLITETDRRIAQFRKAAAKSDHWHDVPAKAAELQRIEVLTWKMMKAHSEASTAIIKAIR